jgi:FixJ family two-component response regulator
MQSAILKYGTQERAWVTVKQEASEEYDKMSTHPRVLIVDDEASLRRQLMVGLAQHGYDVDECDEGLLALTKIRAAESRQDPFYCVILDVRLPDIDGLKVLSVIKAAYAHLPVVVITGFGNEDMVSAVQSHGGSVFLDKPFGMDTLILSLESLGASAGKKPKPRMASQREALDSALIFIRGQRDADLAEIYARLCYAEGVCYCDPVLGAWDIVLLIQAPDHKSIDRIVRDHLEPLRNIEAYEVHACERPRISKELEEFIRDYEKARSMEKAGIGTMDRRHARMLTSYALLDVDPAQLPDLYMKLYFADNVVHCDVTDGGNLVILLLQGVSAQGIQSTVRNEIRMMPGVLRIKQLSALNFSAK